MKNISISCKPFKALSLEELYAIMVLRQEVFVVEQDCPYLDADGKDQLGYHFMIWDKAGELVAYDRILPKGVSYDHYPSIGRILTSEKARGTGIGKLLMTKSIEKTEQLYGKIPIKISAQSYLERFYGYFNFKSTGEEYLEDGIPHMAMIRS